NDVRSSRFFSQRPKCAGPAIQIEEARYGVNARLEILSTDEQNSWNIARTSGSKSCVIDAAFIHNKRHYAFRFPRREFVIELAAGRHAPQQQRSDRQFRMFRSHRKVFESRQKSLAAALTDVHILFDEVLLVRFISETARN